MTTVTAPTARPPVLISRLVNGLRVVVSPEPGSGAVAVAVHYAVGYRSEPPGRAGFAHLFEHLMFQGSAHVAKLEHFRQIQAAGGSCNAITARDHTCYHQIVPTAALELALFLEADRMAAPRFTSSGIANQVQVIREEIGTNVLGRPYGGLPWLHLPPVLFSSYANTHNGYGAVAELSTATVDEAAAFFQQYYCPAAAVLTVAGDVDADTVDTLIGRYFDGIGGGSAPARPDLAEPALDVDREHTHYDRLAPLPATVVAWRVPGSADTGRVPYALLAAFLADGEQARLRRLERTGVCTQVSALPGLTGTPLASLDPDAFVVTAIHRPEGPGTPAILRAVDAELADLAMTGPSPDELDRVATRWTAQNHRRMGRLRERVQALGTREILFGRAELAWEFIEAARDCPPSAIAEAAAALAGTHRVVLHVMPGTAAPAGDAAIVGGTSS